MQLAATVVQLHHVLRWIRRDSAVILFLKFPTMYRSFIKEYPLFEIEILPNASFVRKFEPLYVFLLGHTQSLYMLQHIQPASGLP